MALARTQLRLTCTTAGVRAMRLWMNVLSFNRPRATFHFGFSDNRTHTCTMQHNGQH